MNLITITDPYGHKVRIDKDDLDNPRKKMIPVYNRFGVKIMDQRTYDPKKHGGMTHIIRANIPGTQEYAESQKAYTALVAKMEAEDASHAHRIAILKIRQGVSHA